MRPLIFALAAALTVSACQEKQPKVDITIPRDSSTVETGDIKAAKAAYNAKTQFKKYAPVNMDDVDTSFLNASEKAVVNKLIQASHIMTKIYQRQITPNFNQLRKEINESGLENAKDVARLYSFYFSRCDSLADNYPFFGSAPCPQGAGFYPEDMNRDEFNAWLEKRPKQAAAFKSGYTLIRRKEDRLAAIPYSRAYKKQLEIAANLLREAADLSREPTLARFLRLRADAFLTDDYYESELAWMDIQGNIEVAIGPYEVYDDGLFGYKTAFESFVTLKNPQESTELGKFKTYLRDMEANLPVDDIYKNFKRGFESPIVVADQIQGGGDNINGAQTTAFNLPNDERVREAKGAKKVILKNVLEAKYDLILAPIADKLLVPEQAALTHKNFLAYGTLFHELSHSLGPGTIIKDGRETTVAAELKELHTAMEEGKADVMAAYNMLYMIERGELPESYRGGFLATYYASLFRAMRFGLGSAHAQGAAVQYNYFKDAGAAIWDKEAKLMRLDFDLMQAAITDLTAEFIEVQGDADYKQASEFLSRYAKKDARAEAILKSFSNIPVDIRPIYPKKL